MGAEYLSYVKFIATEVPTFFGYIISVLTSVLPSHKRMDFLIPLLICTRILKFLVWKIYFDELDFLYSLNFLHTYLLFLSTKLFNAPINSKYTHCKCLQGFTGKVHSILVKIIGKHYSRDTTINLYRNLWIVKANQCLSCQTHQHHLMVANEN